MRRSLVISVVAHLLLAFAVVLLSWNGRELPPPEQPIAVEIVSSAPPAPAPAPPRAPPAETAPLPQRQAAAPAPPPPPPKVEPKAAPTPPPPAPPKPPEPAKPVEPPKPEPPKPAEPPKTPSPAKPAEAPKPPEKEPPPKPQPSKPEPPPAPKQAEAKPPEPAKARPEPPKTPPATQAADFDALLRSVEAQNRRVQAPEKQAGKGTVTGPSGSGQPGEAKVAQINPSLLVAAISQQITPCWNIPVAAQGVEGLRAELNIVLGQDGSVQSVAATDAARMSGDPVFRAFAESAIRAVRACAPLKLPAESYQLWRNIIFNFDPAALTG